jgi:hypothetical protein
MMLLKMLHFIYDITLVAWLGAFSQERQGLWLPKDDLRDSSSWSSSPLLLLRDIHSKLLSDYRCKEGCAPSQSQVNVGASGGLSSQDGVSQQQEAAPLSIPQVNCLIEASFVRDESSASNAAVTAIPSQHRVSQQMLRHWQIRPHRRDEAWSASLWQTFFAMTMGAQIPVIAEKPLAACGCRKFQLDALGDHLCTCTAHSGAKIELAAYLANAAGPVPLVLDLSIAHDRFGSSSDHNLNGHLHYPNDIDRSLNEAADDKIRKYRATRSESTELTIIIAHLTLSHLCLLLQVRLGGYIVNL